MTPEQADLCYRALRQNDGHTLAPNWPMDERERLSAVLDELRLWLLTGRVPQEETTGLKAVKK